MSEGDKTNLVNQTDEGADPNSAANGYEAPASAAAAPDEDKSASPSPWQRKLRCPPPRGMTLIVLVSVIFSAGVTFALILTIIFGEPQVQRLGAVAADTTEAGKCGLEMLSNGGSAVDAAVATALCNAVIQYPITGLGGGGLILVHSHRADKTTLFDFLETAPASVTADSFAASGVTRALNSALGAGVPGFVRGLEVAHKRFGHLKWASLFAPAIRLATSGFHLPADVHLLVANNAARVAGNPLLKRLYLTPAGDPKPSGTSITMPELAGALKILRDEGAKAMYTGSLSAQMVSASSSNGGSLTAADFANYQVVERIALVGHYRNFTIRTFPPPSSGGAYTVLLAQMLAGYPVSSTDSANNTGLLHHRFVEAAKLTLGAVEPIGELSGSLATDLATPAYADRLRSHIVDGGVLSATDSSVYAKQPWPQTDRPLQASSHLVAVDNDELYVSMETSINTPFAAGVTTNPNGLLLNNALANFDPSGHGNHSNAAAGGRRPATLMSPSFAFNPRQRCGLRFAFGASNSTAVPSLTAWLATRLTDLTADTTVCPHAVSSRRHDSSRQPCLPVALAAKASRLNPLLPAKPARPVLESESGLPSDISKVLTEHGQKLTVLPSGLGRSQIAAMDMYSLAADSDKGRSGAKPALLPQS